MLSLKLFFNKNKVIKIKIAIKAPLDCTSSTNKKISNANDNFLIKDLSMLEILIKKRTIAISAHHCG